jgi:hypothetical protein
MGPLTPKKIAAQFAFQELYSTRQRRLRHVTLLCRAREVQRPRDSQEVSNLVHFHYERSPGRSPLILY